MLEAQTVMEPVVPMGPPVDYVADGEKLFGEGRIDEARALFQTAVEECPGNALAWNNLAVLALMDSRDREAESHLRRALEVKSDYLEARFNLVEIYRRRGDLRRAARELARVLEFQPGDLPTIKALAQLHIEMGEPEKARRLLEESEGLGAMKAFIDSLWLGIKYYALADDLSGRDKLEKFVVAILKYLDGQEGRSRRYKLVSTDPDTGREVVLEDFSNSFYYKESPSLTLPAEGNGELVLTIGEHDDWLFFREALRGEMRAEGGCLGDFTQTRKLLRREPRLAGYNLESTLKYFRDNVGPCDCHVLRAVLV